MSSAGLGELIIGALGNALGLLNVKQRLHPRRRLREDGYIYPRFIHMLEPLAAQIKQPINNLGCAFRGRGAIKAPERNHPLIRRAIFHHPQIGIDLLLRGKSFFGRDPQIAAISAGF